MNEENIISKIKVVEEDFKPRCPHCEMEVEKLITPKLGFFASNKIFCCPHCYKIVGTGYGT